MTCFRKYILQLLVSIMFLQMHKLMSPKNVVQVIYKYFCCLGRFLKLSWYLNYLKLLFQSNTIILFTLKETLTN